MPRRLRLLHDKECAKESLKANVNFKRRLQAFCPSQGECPMTAPITAMILPGVVQLAFGLRNLM
ncbi:hypothetical protein [Bradyrhizobium ivorense]|uniref:hypothetical protein n=1 Tax=Bradyrhizobium ivorense TaxID=2511166 RepID=UPI0010B4707C|nr:hypothetical protein [Bradyrhizobium ivorense]VIO67761.1 hypothetical protein CI41S_11320 [Bradyrhizobium ivorense]